MTYQPGKSGGPDVSNRHAAAAAPKGPDGRTTGPRRLAAALLTTAISALILSPNCARVGHRDVDLPLPSEITGKATRHAVQNRELRSIMTKLRGLTFERLPQELNDQGRRQDSLQETSSIAKELADSASRIAGVAAETGLTPSEQKVFLTLAGELQQRALKLSSYARKEQTRLVNSTMKEISTTCVNCHRLFRNSNKTSAEDSL